MPGADDDDSFEAVSEAARRAGVPTPATPPGGETEADAEARAAAAEDAGQPGYAAPPPDVVLSETDFNQRAKVRIRRFFGHRRYHVIANVINNTIADISIIVVVLIVIILGVLSIVIGIVAVIVIIAVMWGCSAAVYAPTVFPSPSGRLAPRLRPHHPILGELRKAG